MKPFAVTPEIVRLDGFTLTVFRSDEDEPPKFWNKYNAGKLSLRLSGGSVCEDFGVCRWNGDASRLDYFIGIRKELATGDVSGTEDIVIPGGLYAVFRTPVASHADFVNTIRRTWDYIFSVWLPRSGYRFTGGWQFESYVEHSRAFSEKIHIPIEEVRA